MNGRIYRPGFGRLGFRPGWGRPQRPIYGFGVPFLLGAATATILTPYYYKPYPYYPVYY